MKRTWVIGGKASCRYQDIGHVVGDTMWWVDNSGKVQSKVFDGLKCHHDISRLDMDVRWRGRIDKAGNATLMPPIRVYARCKGDEMPLPCNICRVLMKMGAKRFFVDTPKGLLKVEQP